MGKVLLLAVIDWPKVCNLIKKEIVEKGYFVDLVENGNPDHYLVENQ